MIPTQPPEKKKRKITIEEMAEQYQRDSEGNLEESESQLRHAERPQPTENQPEVTRAVEVARIIDPRREEAELSLPDEEKPNWSENFLEPRSIKWNENETRVFVLQPPPDFAMTLQCTTFPGSHIEVRYEVASIPPANLPNTVSGVQLGKTKDYLEYHVRVPTPAYEAVRRGVTTDGNFIVFSFIKRHQATI